MRRSQADRLQIIFHMNQIKRISNDRTVESDTRRISEWKMGLAGPHAEFKPFAVGTLLRFTMCQKWYNLWKTS